jgi:hypothetical protein
MNVKLRGGAATDLAESAKSRFAAVGAVRGRNCPSPRKSKWGAKMMRKQIGVLSILGILGLAASADAQTRSSAPATPFDGTYRLVSAARVNQMYTTKKGLTAQCPDRRPGPLHIEHGRARYTSATGYRLRGQVDPRGQLAMGSSAPGISRPIDINLNGIVDPNGTVHARQISNACNYDFVWQR